MSFYKFSATTLIVTAALLAACSKDKSTRSAAPAPAPEQPVNTNPAPAGQGNNPAPTAPGTTAQPAPVPAATPPPPRTLAERLPNTLVPDQPGFGIVWEAVKAGGSSACQEANLYPVFSGNSASIGFRNLGLSTPAWSGLAPKTVGCDIEATLTLPKAHYVKSITQTFTTNIVKDIGVGGFLNASGYFYQNIIPLTNLRVTLDPMQSLKAGSPDISQTTTQKLAQESMYAQCANTLLNSQKTSFKFSIIAAVENGLQYTSLSMKAGNNDFIFKIDTELAPCPISDVSGIIGLLPR